MATDEQLGRHIMKLDYYTRKVYARSEGMVEASGLVLASREAAYGDGGKVLGVDFRFTGGTAADVSKLGQGMSVAFRRCRVTWGTDRDGGWVKLRY